MVLKVLSLPSVGQRQPEGSRSKQERLDPKIRFRIFGVYVIVKREWYFLGRLQESGRRLNLEKEQHSRDWKKKEVDTERKWTEWWESNQKKICYKSQSRRLLKKGFILTKLTVLLIPQYIHISNHYDAHPRPILCYMLIISQNWRKKRVISVVICFRD